MTENLKKILKTTDKYVRILQENGIHTLKDLLQYFPRLYEDRKNITPLSLALIDGSTVTTKGQVVSKSFFSRNGKKIFDCTFFDEEGTKGSIQIYNSSFTAQKIKANQRYIIIGKPSLNGKTLTFRHPELIETVAPDHSEHTIKDEHNMGRLYPIYSELMGIKSAWFAKKIWEIHTQISEIFIEYIPTDFLEEYSLLPIDTTIQQMHYPTSLEMAEKAKYRIFFDRLLKVQLTSLLQKQDYGEFKKTITQDINWDIIKHIVEKLPFTLTGAQKKVLKQLIEDLHGQESMMRLLQGDVGSGKTIVAAIAMYYITKHMGGQSVLLAPLEILAQQHLKSIAKLLLPLGIRIELLTGSVTKAEKDKIKQNIRNGQIDILVGTHAVLQEDIGFSNLQFVVIDEQHKFGVRQRAFFKQFNSPHIMQMSATPIPRSMALAFFGEFSVSVIDELPAGRKPIHTKIVSASQRAKLKLWVLDKIEQGQKVFIVTPLIEESEKMENLKAAQTSYEEIKELFPDIKHKIGLLHGRMKSKDKDAVMAGFKANTYDILVSTTVIEVGVDIPNATIMIIQNAERFGLSQLHQLRGRIGRSDLQSYCFLETKVRSGDTYKRLKAMEDTHDGFKLAEIDLQYRGSGELLGTKQSGETDIPLAILSDISFIESVQDAAHELLEKYPGLEKLPNLKAQLSDKIGDVMA